MPVKRVAAAACLVLLVGLLALLAGRSSDDRVDSVGLRTGPSTRATGRHPSPETPSPKPSPGPWSPAGGTDPAPLAVPPLLGGRPTTTGTKTDRHPTRTGSTGSTGSGRVASTAAPGAPTATAPPRGVGSAGPAPVDPPVTEGTTPIDPPSPPRDQTNCPNLGLVAIGDAGPDPTAAAARTRFRALAGAELERPVLVCAHQIRPWRDDLVIQSLVTGGQPDGTLVSGRNDHDPVLRFTTVEWQSFEQFLPGPLDDGLHDYLGVPTGRTTIDGIPMIRTTRGALVMARPDSFGFGVVNGAWEQWMANGGPGGEMGLPAARPTGTRADGAHQDFAFGHLDVPSGTTPLEAEAQPASAYTWYPVAQVDRRAGLPPNHSIVTVEDTSYYLDDDGIRHWIATGDAYGCARRSLGAVKHVVPGYTAAELPLGSQFACP